MVDWSEVGVIVEVAAFLSFVPFTYLAWASGYFDILTEQARKNRWIAPSFARRIGRKPPTKSQAWEAEFGSSQPPAPVAPHVEAVARARSRPPEPAAYAAPRKL